MLTQIPTNGSAIGAAKDCGRAWKSGRICYYPLTISVISRSATA